MDTFWTWYECRSPSFSNLGSRKKCKILIFSLPLKVEFGVENYRSLADFKNPKITLGIKPILLFAGEGFEQESELIRLKSLLMDFFGGHVTDSIRLSGLEHVIQFVAFDGKIGMRIFRIVMKKSGTRVPRIELDEMGPRVDLVVRRTKLASEDLFKRSKKQPGKRGFKNSPIYSSNFNQYVFSRSTETQEGEEYQEGQAWLYHGSHSYGASRLR